MLEFLKNNLMDIITGAVALLGAILSTYNAVKLKKLSFQYYKKRKDFDDRSAIIQETATALSERYNSTKNVTKDKLRELRFRALVYCNNDQERARVTEFYQFAIEHHDAPQELYDLFQDVTSIVLPKRYR